MKEIFISNNGQLLNSVETIGDFEIDLNSDVVICTPSVNNHEEPYDVKFNGYGFSVYNKFVLRLSPQYTFDFFSRVKMTIPNGLKLNISSAIPGLHCVRENYDIYEGINLDEEGSKLNQLNLKFYTNNRNYTFYNKMEYVLKDYNKDEFNKVAKEKYATSIRIPEWENVINIEFVKTFIGLSNTPPLNEVYLIHSDYIYSNLPNLGGDK